MRSIQFLFSSGELVVYRRLKRQNGPRFTLTCFAGEELDHSVLGYECWILLGELPEIVFRLGVKKRTTYIPVQEVQQVYVVRSPHGYSKVVILLYDGKPIELPGLQAPDLFQSTVMKLVTGTPAEQLTQADTHHGQQFVFPSNLIQTRQMDLPMGELEEGAASYRYSDNSSRGGLGSEVLYPPQEPHSSAGGSSMPEVQDSREAAAAAPQERHGPGAGQLHQATAGKQAASTSGLDDYMCEDVSGGGCAPQPMPPITEDHTQEDLAHLAADQSPQIHSRSAARSVPTRSPASQQMRSSEQVSWHNPLWAHGAVCLRLNAAPWLVRPASAAATPSRGPTFSSGGGSVADPRYAPASAAAAGQPLPQLPAPSPPYQAEAPPHNQGQAAGDSRSKGSSSQGSDRSGDSAQLPASMAAPPSACVLQACPSGQLQHSEAGPTLYRCSADAAGHSPARQQVPAAGVLSGISPGRARGRSRSEGGLPQPNHHEQYPAVAAGSRSPGTPGLPALQPASSAPVLRASTAQSHASAAAAGNHYKSLSIAVDTSSRPASPRHVFGAHAIYSPVRGHPASESGVPRHHRLQAAHGPSLPGRTSAPPLTSSGQAVSSTMGRSSHSDSVWGSVHSSHLSNKQGPGTGRQRGNRNGPSLGVLLKGFALSVAAKATSRRTRHVRPQHHSHDGSDTPGRGHYREPHFSSLTPHSEDDRHHHPLHSSPAALQKRYIDHHQGGSSRAVSPGRGGVQGSPRHHQYQHYSHTSAAQHHHDQSPKRGGGASSGDVRLTTQPYTSTYDKDIPEQQALPHQQQQQQCQARHSASAQPPCSSGTHSALMRQMYKPGATTAAAAGQEGAAHSQHNWGGIEVDVVSNDSSDHEGADHESGETAAPTFSQLPYPGGPLPIKQGVASTTAQAAPTEPATPAAAGASSRNIPKSQEHAASTTLTAEPSDSSVASDTSSLAAVPPAGGGKPGKGGRSRMYAALVVQDTPAATKPGAPQMAGKAAAARTAVVHVESIY